MYTTEAITTLAESIGFGVPLDTSIILSGANETGSSGMKFSSFHELVTVGNLMSSFDEDLIADESLLDEEFTRIREDAAKVVIANVFDKYPDYVDATDYSQIIIDKTVLLRSAFALQVSLTCLEIMAASKRFNINQRSIKESFGYLKIEIEGTKDSYGNRVSYGIKGKARFAVVDAIKVIWAVKPTVNNSNTW